MLLRKLVLRGSDRKFDQIPLPLPSNWTQLSMTPDKWRNYVNNLFNNSNEGSPYNKCAAGLHADSLIVLFFHWPFMIFLKFMAKCGCFCIIIAHYHLFFVEGNIFFLFMLVGFEDNIVWCYLAKVKLVVLIFVISLRAMKIYPQIGFDRFNRFVVWKYT